MNWDGVPDERIAAGRFSATLDIPFCIPGTNIPATVGGFGIVMLDVDSSASHIETYAVDGVKLNGQSFNAASNGLSFIGLIPPAGTRIARVVVQAGNTPLGTGDVDGIGGVDVVAVDDVIFGEPRAIMQGAHDFDGDGVTDFSIFGPSTGQWFIARSGGLGPAVVQWGE